MMDYPIFVYDTDIYLRGVVNDYFSLIWSDRFYELGDFELSLPATTENIKLFAPDNFIMTLGSDRFMCIEGVTLSYDNKTGPTLSVSGRSGESILDRRITWKEVDYAKCRFNSVLYLLSNNVIWPARYEDNTYKREINNFRFRGVYDLAHPDPVFTYDQVPTGIKWTYHTRGTATYVSSSKIKLPSNHADVAFRVYATPVWATSTVYYHTYDYNKNMLNTYTFEATRGEILTQLVTITESNARYVDFDLHSPLYNYGGVSWIIMNNKENYGMDTTQRLQCTGENLGETIRALLKSARAGYKITLDTTNRLFEFRIYNGSKRSMDNGYRNAIIFSADTGNIEKTEDSLDYTKRYTNMLIGGVQPEEGSKKVRKWVSIANHGSNPTTHIYHDADGDETTVSSWKSLDGLARREYYYDASDVPDYKEVELTSGQINSIKSWHAAGKTNSEIIDLVYDNYSKITVSSETIDNIIDGTKSNNQFKGTQPYTTSIYKEVLKGNGQKLYDTLEPYQAFSGSLLQNSMYNYNKTIFMGDRVSYHDPYGNVRTGRITEWIFSYSSSGQLSYPTIEENEIEMEDELT